jgi:hypothetical protein
MTFRPVLGTCRRKRCPSKALRCFWAARSSVLSGHRVPRNATTVVTVAGKPRLLDRVRHALRVRRLARTTEKAYVYWTRPFILHDNKRALGTDFPPVPGRSSRLPGTPAIGTRIEKTLKHLHRSKGRE